MKYYQGRFIPKNPEKYVGDANNIIARSSWEFKLFKWLDENPTILKYASEEMFVPYISPKDGQIHRYFPDVLIQYKDKDGNIKKAMIEVKPDAQTRAPKFKGRQTQRFLNETITYAVNQAKWESAKKWCEKNKFDFWIFTEYELDIKKRK